MQKSAAIAPPAASALTPRSVAPYLLWTLLAAGLGEMFLYRMLSRVGVHIPKEGVVLDVYDALVRLGSFAFNVSSVVVFLALGLLAWTALGSDRGRRRAALQGAVWPLIVTFGALSLLLAFVDEGDDVRLGYGGLSAGIMLLLAVLAGTDGRLDGPRKAVVGLIVLAYLVGQYYVLANQAYRVLGLAASPPGTARALEVAELLVVVNAFVAFWAWSGVRAGRMWRPSSLQLGAAALLVLVFLGARGGEDASTASILSLWTLGLTLYLPLPLYALALALYGAALAGCLARARRDPTAVWDGIALGLLPVAGLTLEMTYQHLVALVALLLLVYPPPTGDEPFAPEAGRL